MDSTVSIIIVNYGTPELLNNLLNSIKKNLSLRVKTDYAVVIVDNGYPEKGDARDTVDPRLFPFKINFVQNHKSSYASGANCGAKLTTSDIIIIANSDVEILPNTFLESLTSIFLRDRRIGIAGPQLVYPGGSWQRSYGSFPSLREGFTSLFLLDSLAHGIDRLLIAINLMPSIIKTVSYVDGAFMAIRRKCFEQLRGFNEQYQFYGEDADLCYRAKKLGWKVIFLPTVRVTHLRGASSTQKSFIEYTARQFMAKLQFVNENNGYKYAWRYKQLIKAVILQRVLFYSVITKMIPLNELKRRKDQSKLCYVSIKNLFKIQ